MKKNSGKSNDPWDILQIAFQKHSVLKIPIEITLFGIIMTNIIIIKKTFITGIMGPEI